jgi:hypothetical protein
VLRDKGGDVFRLDPDAPSDPDDAQISMGDETTNAAQTERQFVGDLQGGKQ